MMVQEKKEKGFFKINEGILLISSNYQEKQQIEDGLNREITRITTLKDLVITINDLSMDAETIRASVIMTKEMPKEIRASLHDVVSLLNVIDVPVFEIGIGETVDNAKRFGNINDFLSFARVATRKNKISEVTDKEQQTILEELQVENDTQREKIKELEVERGQLEKDLEAAKGRIETLETNVEHVYKVQLEEAETKVKDLEDRIYDINKTLEIEKQKSSEYRDEKDESLGQLTDMRFTLKSLREKLADKQNELRRIEKRLANQKEENKRLEDEKEKILLARVDAEEHVLLKKELEKKKQEIDILKDTVTRAELEVRKIKYEKDLLTDEIDFLRDGEVNLKEYGRTLKLDKFKFDKTDIVYIKVFEPLPYFRLATRMFFEKLAKKYKRSHLMILKHDDGQDNLYFEGIPLWSKLKDVPSSDRIFRLFPNSAMFTRADKWAEKVGLLIVVDYIKNNEYVISSIAKERYLSVVRKEQDIEKYELKGSPISIEGNTVFDIKHDAKISGSGIQKNRHMMVSNKVDKWIKNIE